MSVVYVGQILVWGAHFNPNSGNNLNGFITKNVGVVSIRKITQNYDFICIGCNDFDII